MGTNTGILSYISVGSKDHVWGIRWRYKECDNHNGLLCTLSGCAYSQRERDFQEGQVFRWNGVGWDRIPDKLKQISVAFDGTDWGVQYDQDIFYFENKE